MFLVEEAVQILPEPVQEAKAFAQERLLLPPLPPARRSLAFLSQNHVHGFCHLRLCHLQHASAFSVWNLSPGFQKTSLLRPNPRG